MTPAIDWVSAYDAFGTNFTSDEFAQWVEKIQRDARAEALAEIRRQQTRADLAEQEVLRMRRLIADFCETADKLIKTS